MLRLWTTVTPLLPPAHIRVLISLVCYPASPLHAAVMHHHISTVVYIEPPFSDMLGVSDLHKIVVLYVNMIIYALEASRVLMLPSTNWFRGDRNLGITFN